MGRALITGVITTIATALAYVMGIWTGGNPEAFCNATSGLVNTTTCMDSLGQIINMGGMQ